MLQLPNLEVSFILFLLQVLKLRCAFYSNIRNTTTIGNFNRSFCFRFTFA